MATISELAQTRQKTQVSTGGSGARGMANVGQRKVTKAIDANSGLMSDIGKLFGNVHKAKSEASAYAGERVGIDNLMEYKKDLSMIEEEYARNPNKTASDMLAKTHAEQGLYDYYMAKGAFPDNELASDAFKDSFAVPAQNILGKSRVSNTEKATSLFKDSEKVAITEQINGVGSDMNPQLYGSLHKRWTESGNSSIEFKGTVLSMITEGFYADVKTNPSSYHNEAGQIDKEALNIKIEKAYSLVSGEGSETIKTILKKGKIAVNSSIEASANKANKEYTDRATIYAKSMRFTGTPYPDSNGVQHWLASEKEYDKLLKSNFPLLSTDEHTKLMNLYRQETSSTGMSSAITEWTNGVKRFDSFNKSGKTFSDEEWLAHSQQGYILYNHPNTTDAQRGTIKKILLNTNNNQKIARDTQANLGVQSEEVMSKKYDNGYESIDSEGKSVYVSSDDVKTIVDNKSADIAKNIKDSDGSDMQGFYSKMTTASHIRKIQGKAKSDSEAYFNHMLTPSDKVMNKNDFKLLGNFMQWSESSGDNSYAFYDNRMRNIASVLAQAEKTPEGEAKALKEANAQYKAMIRDKEIIQSRHGKAFKSVQTELVRIAGGDNWSDLTSIFMDSDKMAHDLLRSRHGDMDELSIKEWFSDFDRADIGTGLGYDKRSVIPPKGVKERQFQVALDEIIAIDNESNGDDTINQDDIIPITMYTDEDGYHILLKAKNRVIGKITSGSYTAIKINQEIQKKHKPLRGETKNESLNISFEEKFRRGEFK